MLETQGLLQLTARSENYRREGQLLYRTYGQSAKHAVLKSTNTASAKASSSSGSTLGNSNGSTAATGSLAAKSAITLPKGALDGPMHDFWQRAADKAAEHAPTADTVKRLQDASKSDNKEIAAQKLQQAKSKLQSLRMQAQMAAAAGDKQQLRHIAQEVAAAAHDVASAAHDLAGSVSASVGSDTGGAVPTATTGDSSEAANKENAATGTAKSGGSATAVSTDTASGADASTATDTTDKSAAGTAAKEGTSSQGPTGAATTDGNNKDLPIYAQAAPQDGDKLAWGEKALRGLANDAGNAIAQARGLLAFIGTALRSRRDPREAVNDERFITNLQQSVDADDQQVKTDIAAAGRDIAASQPTAADTNGSGSVLGIDTVTVTTVTTTALFLNITA
jgi:hypothetical protein